MTRLASSASGCQLVVFAVLVWGTSKLSAQETGSIYNTEEKLGPYLQVYPPAEIVEDPSDCTPSENVTCPLYLTLMLSLEGPLPRPMFVSGGALPGVQIALDQVNNDSSILPGYRLHYLLSNSECDPQVTLHTFHTHLIEPPTKIGVLGAGCSFATEKTAEIGPFYNLTQVSCASSSAGLTNRKRFQKYFQVSASELNLIFGFYGIIRNFGWDRISIITQDDDTFTVTVDRLKELLRGHGVSNDIREIRFDTKDGFSATDEPLDNESRIFILAMFPEFSRQILCMAHQRGWAYPRSLFFVFGWYHENWWKEDEANLTLQYPGCDIEGREKVLEYTLAPRKAGRTFRRNESHLVADSGISGAEIEDLYEVYLNASHLEISSLNFYQQCYDATWAMARALNATLAEIRSDPDRAAQLANSTRGQVQVNAAEEFGLQHFTYKNSMFGDMVFRHLEATDFRGIVGDIRFDNMGNRVVPTVDVLQYVRDSGTKSLKVKKIGDIIRGDQENDTRLEYVTGESNLTLFPAGVPLDGVPCVKVVGVNPGLSGFFVVLATIGIILALSGIISHMMLRNKAVIRLSSPNLNLLIGVGAIILYVDIIVTVLPTTGESVQGVLCNLTPWLTAIGYSLCYGTILAKMARVYYIFDNPSQTKKKPLQDWMLLLGVLVLVAIDVGILLVYDVVEGSRGNLGATRFPNKEHLNDLQGPLEKITDYFVYVCQSKSRSITLGILYGYKMILQIISLIFAFSIRKVKIKGLNDAKYIAVAVYITSIVTAIIIVITYTLNRHLNIFAGLFSAGFFIGTTAILGLVMIPPLFNHMRDPNGERIFSAGDISDSNRKRSLQGLSGHLAINDEDTEKEGLKKKIADLEKRLTLIGEENLRRASEGYEAPQEAHKSQVVTFTESSSQGTSNSKDESPITQE